MKMRDVAEVTLKILGVYFIVEATLKIPALVFFLHALYSDREAGVPEQYRPVWVQSQNRELATQLGQFAVYVLGAVLLLWCARRIADWLLRDDAALSSGEVQMKVVSPESFLFCLKLIGVYALFRAAELLAQGVGRTRVDSYANYGISSSLLLPFLPGALVLALAIYLLRGGDWLVRFAWPEWDEEADEDVDA